MNYYESQTRQNLQEAKENAKYNGTWDSISMEHSEVTATLESMFGMKDDDFKDVYEQSKRLRDMA